MNIQVASAILRAAHATTRQEAVDRINTAVDHGLSADQGAQILADWDKHNRPQIIEAVS